MAKNKPYTSIPRPYGDHLEREPDMFLHTGEAAGIPGAGMEIGGDGSSTAKGGGGASAEVKTEGNISDLWIDTFIRSKNWKPKTMGFYLDGQTGYAEFSNLFIKEGLVAGSGEIGGWKIRDNELWSGKVRLQSVEERILMGDATSPLVGNGIFIGKDGNDYEFRAGDPSSGYIHWDGQFLRLDSGVITNLGSGSDLNIMGWQFDASIAPIDNDTVAWGTGTLEFPNGETYSIPAGDTGDIGAIAYIYFDKTTPDNFLVTATASMAVGNNKVLVAVAYPNVSPNKLAIVQAFGGAGGMSPSVGQGNIDTGAVGSEELMDGAVTAIKASISTRGWAFDFTTTGFAPISHNEVAWGSGDFVTAAGDAYPFAAGSTPVIPPGGKIYLYVDAATNPNTATIETSSLASDTVGENKVLIGVASANANPNKVAIIQIFGGAGGMTPSVGQDNLEDGAVGPSELMDGAVTSIKTSVSSRGWAFDFSSAPGFQISNNEKLQWAAGAFTTSAGDSYPFVSGETPVVTYGQRRYLYIDVTSSPSAASINSTLDINDAVGESRVLIGVAELTPNSVLEYQIFGGHGGVALSGESLAANSVTANQIATGTITANEIATGTITADEIAAGTITSSQIAANTITATELAAGTITANEIATGTITANEIAGKTITAAEIASNTITATQIATNTITATQIAAETITSNLIAANAITATQIAAGAITTGKIAAGAVTAGKINVDELSAITADMGSLTAGDITLPFEGFIRSGMTDYFKGEGFWLGSDEQYLAGALWFPYDDGLILLNGEGETETSMQSGDVNTPWKKNYFPIPHRIIDAAHIPASGGNPPLWLYVFEGAEESEYWWDDAGTDNLYQSRVHPGTDLVSFESWNDYQLSTFRTRALATDGNMVVAVGSNAIATTSTSRPKIFGPILHNTVSDIFSGVRWTNPSYTIPEHTYKRDILFDVMYEPSISRWVAVGEGGLTATSTDGASWSLKDSGGLDLFKVIYNGGEFLAAGRNEIKASSDGVNWTTRNYDNRIIRGMAYGNNTYFAATSEQSTLLSSDGINWTPVVPSSGEDISRVAFGAGLFVGISTSGTSKIYTSPDGTTWTERTNPPGGGTLSDIIYADNKFVIVGGKGLVSADGITWSVSTRPGVITYLDHVAYGNGVFVAVGWGGSPNQIAYSSDGVTWTQASAPTGMENSQWSGIAYGNGVFVAVTTSGGSSGPGAMTSPDGINWTAQSGLTEFGATSIAYGNGVFVARKSISPGGGMLTSTDGVTWSLDTSFYLSSANLSFLNGFFMATGRTGEKEGYYNYTVFKRSIDGVTWEDSIDKAIAVPWNDLNDQMIMDDMYFDGSDIYYLVFDRATRLSEVWRSDARALYFEKCASFSEEDRKTSIIKSGNTFLLAGVSGAVATEDFVSFTIPVNENEVLFSLGNSDNKYLSWDGLGLQISGDILGANISQSEITTGLFGERVRINPQNHRVELLLGENIIGVFKGLVGESSGDLNRLIPGFALQARTMGEWGGGFAAYAETDEGNQNIKSAEIVEMGVSNHEALWEREFDGWRVEYSPDFPRINSSGSYSDGPWVGPTSVNRVGVGSLRPFSSSGQSGNSALGNVTWRWDGLTARLVRYMELRNDSDSRLKDNVENISYGLDAVKALRPVEFDWRLSGEHGYGFIAQEVQQVMPEVVEESMDEDEELSTPEEKRKMGIPEDVRVMKVVSWHDKALDKKTPTPQGTLAIKTDAMIPMLTKAIQELAERVELLDNKVNNLIKDNE